MPNRNVVARIDAERKRVYASFPLNVRFVKAVRGFFKKAFNDSYSKRDIEVLFNSILTTHKVDTSLGWNWGHEIMTSTMKVFRDFQSKSRSLSKEDFDDMLSHVVTSLVTGTDSANGSKFGHGDIGQICSDYLATGRSPLDIVKLVKNRVFQLGSSWMRKQSRHVVVNQQGKSLQDTGTGEDKKQLSERIVDLQGLNKSDQNELRTDLKSMVDTIRRDLEKQDPALGMIWQAYLENPDVENAVQIGREPITIVLNNKTVTIPLVEALNKTFIEGTSLKPYTERSVYYLVTKIRTYLKAKWGDVIEAALGR